MAITRNSSSRRRAFRRRGAAAVSVAICGTAILGFAALAIDVGMLYHVRAEAQRSADAAALAGAWKLLGEQRLSGDAGLSAVIADVRQAASSMAGNNQVFNGAPSVDQNTANVPTGDVVLGRLADLFSLSGQMDVRDDPWLYNAVSVRVRRDSGRNGPIPLLFARILGFKEGNVSTRAMAAISDGVAGYRVTPQTGNAELLPLALSVKAWDGLMAGTWTTGDNYTYDPDSGTVSPGPDGILELDLYPGSGPTQLPPGNFGTVDIGNPNNSTSDISRQIRHGVNGDDLAFFGGELTFDDNGEIRLHGDTGLSAAIKDDLASIIGLPRSVPLFGNVSGPGNNAVFTVVRFAGIRVLDVKLTGAMSKKKVIIQPAIVVDDAIITNTDATSSYFVYAPPRLVR